MERDAVAGACLDAINGQERRPRRAGVLELSCVLYVFYSVKPTPGFSHSALFLTGAKNPNNILTL